jgi:phage gpG-like protein
MIPNISSNAQEVMREVAKIARGLQNDEPLRQQLGELGVLFTKQRLEQSKDVTGAAFKPLSATTIAQHIAGFGKRNFTKGGGLSKSGRERLASRKPLVKSGMLATQIFYNVIPGGVEIGSPMDYSAVQNFGQKKGASGTMKNGAPIPWGDIPARQFLGIADSDADAYLAASEAYVVSL